MKVNICGVNHTIEYKNDDFQIDDTKFGFIDYSKAKIVINNDITEDLKKETLCHEIVHGILFHIGRQDLSNDENLVQALANAINQSFTVNYYIDDKEMGSVSLVNINEQK